MNEKRVYAALVGLKGDGAFDGPVVTATDKLLRSFADQLLTRGSLSPRQLEIAERELPRYVDPLPVARIVATEGPELFEDEVVDDTAYANSRRDLEAYGRALAGRNSQDEKWNRGYVAPKRAPFQSTSVRRPSSTTLEQLFGEA